MPGGVVHVLGEQAIGAAVTGEEHDDGAGRRVTHGTGLSAARGVAAPRVAVGDGPGATSRQPGIELPTA